MITTEEAAAIAKLAKLQFEPNELEALTGDLNNVLGYIDQLKEVNIDGVEPLENLNETVKFAAFRADVPGPCLTQEEALKNAPKAADGYYLVPKVVGQEAKNMKTLEDSDEVEDF